MCVYIYIYSCHSGAAGVLRGGGAEEAQRAERRAPDLLQYAYMYIHIHVYIYIYIISLSLSIHIYIYIYI